MWCMVESVQTYQVMETLDERLSNPSLSFRNIDGSRTNEEIYRLTTFQEAPGAVNGSELAGRGFYYISLTRQIRCFSCGRTHILTNETTFLEDFDHDRCCDFNNGTDRRNVPIGSQSHWSTSPSFSNERSNVNLPTAPPHEAISPLEVQDEESEEGSTLFACENPKHPDMRDIESRKRSFLESPNANSAVCTPGALAKAGLFYSRHEDQVLCWYCGKRMDQWEALVNPWFEHAKRSSECEFLLREKGLEFVEEVASRTSTTQRKQTRPMRESRNPKNEINPSTSSSDPPNVTIFPRPNWQREDHGETTVYRAPGIEITTNRSSEPQSTSNFQITTSRRNTSVNPTSPEQESFSPIVAEALNMGFSMTAIQNAMSRELLRSGQVHLDLHDLLNDIMNHPEEEEEEEEWMAEIPPQIFQQSIGSSRSTGRVQNNITITGGNFRSSVLPGGEVLSSPELSSQSNRCVICDDEPADTLFLPCSHLITCSLCSTLLQYCPGCKSKIDRWIKVKTSQYDH